MGCGAVVLGRVVKKPTFLTLRGMGQYIIGLSININFMGEDLSTEGNFGNIGLGLLTASGRHSVAMY